MLITEVKTDETLEQSNVCRWKSSYEILQEKVKTEMKYPI